MKRHAWERDDRALDEERYQGHHLRWSDLADAALGHSQPYAFWLPPLRETRHQRRRRIHDENSIVLVITVSTDPVGAQWMADFTAKSGVCDGCHYCKKHHGFKARNARRSAR